MSVRTQGTALYFAAGSPLAINKMTCPTGISGLGGARDQINDTCLDDLDEHSYVAGLANPGAVSVPFVLKPSEADHHLLFELKESGEKIQWVIGLSDGLAAPTLGLDDELELPDDRTTALFTAYVADVDIDIATNEVVRGTLQLQRSGRVNWNWKS